ncbi:MAG: 5-formyltetrahydrofolate cyclo-ligase [Bacteroidota bacterium]|nr:5-formyltetrahydrofolate cyclo-ligase [Bacteroidota bacterium]
MLDVRTIKRDLRCNVRNLKKKYSYEQLKEMSETLWPKLENDPLFKNARTVMLYWSLSDEVHTHEFIQKWAGPKKIILPSIDGDNLLLKQFVGIDNLVKGEGMGIPEPSGPIFEAIDSIDLVIVPGVAFDRSKNRLGRGKGYYDRLLRSLTCKKAGVCFKFQLFDSIPVEIHDFKMDYIFYT